nr:RidA family protein [Leucobacter luti]
MSLTRKDPVASSRLTRTPADTGDALSAQFTTLDGVAYITVIPTVAGGALAPGTDSDQAEAIFDNLERKLAAAGASLADIAQFTVYLCDIADTLAPFNAVYARRMPRGLAPMRCAVGVAALARPAMRVEVSVVAAVPRAAAAE